MMNSFKKRLQKKAAATAQPRSPKSPPTDYSSFTSKSDLPPRAGIFIASAPSLPRSSLKAQQKAAAASTSSPKAKGKGKAKAGPSSPPLPSSPPQQKKQSLDHVLPSSTDFRQSLIMPHLSRRFTLLRAPDGSLVSPDAMRAHLRAQRARARATNLAQGPSSQVHFLTEDEENEIIEQLKAQARQEGRDFDNERRAATNGDGVDSWRSGYNTGTDGFGLWGTSSSNNANKLSTLAESLGEFSAIPDYPAGAADASSPMSKTGNSSFTGRSAERDHAYIRSVQRERNHSKSDEPLNSLTSESDSPSSRNTTLATSADDSRHHSHATTESAATDVQDNRLGDGPSSKGLLNVPGLDPSSRPRTSQDSNLLTTLSPEAFKRVSTALDEVFGLIALERGPSFSVPARSTAPSHHAPQRSSMESDVISFTSALSHVRALDSRQPSSGTVSSSDVSSGTVRTRTASSGHVSSSTVSSNQHDTASRYHDDDDTADHTVTTQPTLDAVHIEQGHLALHSPLPGPIPGALPDDFSNFTLNEAHAGTEARSLAPSNSFQTVTDSSLDTTPRIGSSLQLQPDDNQHRSVSGQSFAGSMLALPSDRTSTVTARDAQPQASRVVSTASTINGPQSDRQEADAVAPAAAIAQAPERPPVGAMLPPPMPTGRQSQVAHPDRTPEMTSSAFFASPAQSSLSRDGSVVSGGNSVRSSLTGSSALYQGSHSRKPSADRLAFGRAMAPQPPLRDQPSLSSVRRNYRHHNRSNTGSSEGSMFAGLASRRSSGAMSPPPLLSRTARSPNYFPPPSSVAFMHDYASGFKPPSAISPAATAALQSMAGQASANAQPTPSSVLDASNALRSAQNVRNSTSTVPSIASPHVPSLAAFASGSDRAAATSSPETGTTSTSLHQRNASLNSTKRQSQTHSARVSTARDSLLPTLSAPPRPAPVPELQVSTNGSGSMQASSADPEQAEGWRAMYGSKGVDTASINASGEDVLVDSNDDEDLWAKMASASDPQKAERPVSNFPPGIAEERLAGTGITFDQMANFQDRLIQTATNGAEAVPPLPVPRIQADSVVLDHQQQKFADAKSKGLASPNLVFDSEPNWSTPAASTPTSKARGLFPSGNERLINTDRNAPTRGSLATSVGQDSPISPRAVMYDVTTSHRPTSPVLHSRTGSLSGLPSLLELNGHRDRESFSLSQAVEQASRLPSQTVFESPPIPEEPSSTHDSQYAVATNAVQDHPFNVGYTSPRLPLADLYQGNSFSPAAVGDSPRHQVQTTLPEDVWDRYGPQQGDMTPDLFDTSMSPNSSYMGADPSRLLDDVAAQTSAATRALKGTDDGVTPTPPFRTKSILRKKSFKKVSKQISSPQLISTTQKLDHATLISPVLEKPTAPTKSPSSARSHVKASPSRGSQMGSIGKSSNYFHRRRSSSFGHEATPDNSFGLGNDGFGDALASQGQGSSDTGPGVHPNHPYMNGGANSGSLSRIFSKINRRKNEQAYGGATIEPFPPELSAAARSSALFSQQPPVRPPQAPVTPELPPLPPVIERSTPWTLPPRMPSSSSSTGHASSLRSPISPTSPVYTLPIDSTLMPRSKSKKKRTPIVLKRDSEVILPGDPGYIPTAIIGRSPEQRALELAEEQSGDSDMLRAVQGAVSPTYSHANVGGRTQLQEQSTDTTLSRSSERMDYSENSNPDILAPLAALNIGDANETKTPRPASPLSLAVSPLKVASAKETVDEALARTMQSSVTPQQTQLDAEVEAATQQPRTQSRPTDPRKSLRDTIVRRTIIIPSGSIDFGDYDRRSLHFSSRKSRRFATSVDEPVPTSANATQSFDVDSPAKVVPAGLPEPDLPAVGLSTFNSAATLTADGSLSNRASGLGGSDYAGSLYDMYISGTPDESGEPESPGSDDAQSLPRRSRVPPPARHIEVTERADGSVVWQVIAGLADRNSVDSVVMRHSQEWSEASGSAKLGSFEREQEAWAPFSSRTAADEDERSFFTRPRAAPKAVAAGMGEDTFDMATPHKQGLRNAVTDAEPSPTRIMYHNDAQLASLLDVLAQGKDSAKFEFHLGPQQVRSPGLNRGSPSTFSGGADSWQGTPIVDANDIESHRSRVEAEIYTLLNRHALDDIQA